MDEPVFFRNYFDQLGLNQNTRRFIIDSHTQGRHYHGLGHLALMIRELASEWDYRASHPLPWSAENRKQRWPSLLLAVLFHDIVYDARAPKNENEELSAATMKLHSPEGTNVALVERMILATRSHQLPEGDSWDIIAIRDFLMADLGILWTPRPNTYAWYARGVRKEYGWVPNEVYRARRAEVLDVLETDIWPHLKLESRYQLERNIAWENEQLRMGLLDV